MRYRNVAAAVEWLCTAFGVETDALVTGDDNSVIYAQLVWGPSIIMIVSVGQSHLDGLMRQPGEVGGAETQSCYLVVADVEKHYARAKAAGAEIVLEMVGGEIGRRGYSCRDPEGHIWSFGTYDPFQGRPLRRDTVVDRSFRPRSSRQHWVLTAGLAAILLAPAVLRPLFAGDGAAAFRNFVAGLSQNVAPEAATDKTLEAAREEILHEQAARAAAEFSAQRLKDELVGERLAKEVAVRAAVEAEARLAQGIDTQRLGLPQKPAASAPEEEKVGEPPERALDGPKEAKPRLASRPRVSHSSPRKRLPRTMDQALWPYSPQ